MKKNKNNNQKLVNSLSSNILKNSFYFQRLSQKIYQYWKLLGFDGAIRILGLTYLATANSPDVAHFTTCPLSNLGFEYC